MLTTNTGFLFLQGNYIMHACIYTIILIISNCQLENK